MTTKLSNWRHFVFSDNMRGVVIPFINSHQEFLSKILSSRQNGWRFAFILKCILFASRQAQSTSNGLDRVSISDKHLIVRSLKVSKSPDWYSELYYRSELWQAPRQPCCRRACQISKRCDNVNNQSRGFDATFHWILKGVIHRTFSSEEAKWFNNTLYPTNCPDLIR